MLNVIKETSVDWASATAARVSGTPLVVFGKRTISAVALFARILLAQRYGPAASYGAVLVARLLTAPWGQIGIPVPAIFNRCTEHLGCSVEPGHDLIRAQILVCDSSILATQRLDEFQNS